MTLALGALAFGCDGANESAEGGDELAFAGFALTGDDQSDDGFTDSADTQPLADAIGPEAQPEDGSELPTPVEMDAEPLPPEGADRIYRTVLVVWGQPRLNPEVEVATEWKGRVATDTGALRVARVLRFERAPRDSEEGADEGDHLVPDDDPAAVSFRTLTRPHNDGLLLVLALPRDPAAVVGDLVFETEYYTKSIPLAELVAGEVFDVEVDDLGNHLLVASHAAHRCPHGMLRWHWERKNDRGGIFGGKVFDARGEVAGYVVGIWGEVEGKRRFKGSFLGVDRQFRGTVRGTWAPFPPESGEEGGTFRGFWSTRGQLKGVLGGVYRIGDEPGTGSAAGFWRAACLDRAGACGGDLALPEPPAPDCACEPDPENDSDEACGCSVPPPSSCVPPEPSEPSEPTE
jgi:hypothetical protein